MSDDQQILPCVVCNRHHQQMLMLSCLHDPCINCAAVHYVHNSPKNSQYYSCSKCSQHTQLDQSSIHELQKVYRTLKPVQQVDINIKQESKKYQYNRTIPSVSRQARQPRQLRQIRQPRQTRQTRQTRQPRQIPKTQKQEIGYKNFTPPASYNRPVMQPANNSGAYEAGRRTILMCSQHPEDQLSYFCFSCNKPICPQCAIHGSHREHEVQACRRAIATIKGRLNQANQKLTVQIGNLNHKKNEGRQHIGFLAQSNKRDQDQVRKQFGVLKNLITQKQGQFLRAMNQNYERNCEQARYCSQIIDKLIKSYTNVRQSIDLTVKKDDLSVLQQFSKRQKQAEDTIYQNATLSQQSRVKSTKQVDQQVFEDQISQVSGIVESMKLVILSNKNQY